MCVCVCEVVYWSLVRESEYVIATASSRADRRDHKISGDINGKRNSNRFMCKLACVVVCRTEVMKLLKVLKRENTETQACSSK